MHHLSGGPVIAANLLFYIPTEATERVALPVFACGLRAGFPSPADDYIEGRLDLNDLVQHREATFYARVEGDSMMDVGIQHGDLLMIDKSLTAELGDIVVAEVDGCFTVKRLAIKDGKGMLMPANTSFAPIPVCPEQGVLIWGVVIHVIKDVRQRRRR